MGASDIQSKIKRGLAKAIDKTGSSDSEPVYLVSVTNYGGETPIDTPVTVSEDIPLVDAIFKSYNKKLIGGTIQAGDRQLVSNGDVILTVGDTIKQGDTNYIVIDPDIKAPTSDVLVYISQVRVK